MKELHEKEGKLHEKGVELHYKWKELHNKGDHYIEIRAKSCKA